MLHRIALLLAVWLIACQAMMADTLTIPNTFTAGTTIQSSQMNANFSAINTWSTAIANDNIKTAAAISPAKLGSTAAYPLLLLAAGTTGFSIGNTGDTVRRFGFDSDGKLTWGAGGASAVDVMLKRSAAGKLAVRNGTDAANADLEAAAITATTTTASTHLSTPLLKLTNGNALNISAAAVAADRTITAVEPGASASLRFTTGSFNNGGSVYSDGTNLLNTAAGTSSQVLVGGTPPSFASVPVAALSSLVHVFGGSGRRTFPTSGSVSGYYEHDGNWSSTNSLTVDKFCVVRVRGTFTLNAGHTITVNSSLPGGEAPTTTFGSPDGAGPGAGRGDSRYAGISRSGGGGGGNGGAGGGGGSTGGEGGAGGAKNGGPAYDWFTFPLIGGSGGGAGSMVTTAGAAGGAGGGVLIVISTGAVSIDANITAAGSNAGATGGGNSDCGAGGGAGGTVVFVTDSTWTLQAGRTISVAGGAGGAGTAANGAGGGGGSGGKVIVRSTGAATTTGTIAVTAGAAGAGAGAGGAGTAGAAGVSDVVGGASYPGLF